MLLRNAIIDFLLKRDGLFCKYCKRPFTDLAPPEIDHIFAICNGGKDEIENYQLLHSICNRRKGAKPVQTRKKSDGATIVEISRFKEKQLIEEINSIRNALIENNCNVTQAAVILGIPRRRINYLMERFGLTRDPKTWNIIQN